MQGGGCNTFILTAFPKKKTNLDVHSIASMQSYGIHRVPCNIIQFYSAIHLIDFMHYHWSIKLIFGIGAFFCSLHKRPGFCFVFYIKQIQKTKNVFIQFFSVFKMKLYIEDRSNLNSFFFFGFLYKGFFMFSI